jgi:hypothetical protein
MSATNAAKVLLVLVGAGLLAGCGGVLSENPASDATTSQADAALIGFWRVDWAASAAFLGKDGKPGEGLFVVGRKAGAENVLELVSVGMKRERVDLTRGEIYATKAGAVGVLSLRQRPEPEDAEGEKPAKEKDVWAIVRYEASGDGSLVVHVMDEQAVAADVKAGKVAGKSEEKPGKEGEPPTVTVMLSAGPDALRAWIESRKDDIWAKDRPLVLKRLDLR